MTDEKPPSARLEQWVNIGATIVAPTTLLGALLFYFGYVSSRSQHAYFGVDVDTIGLSTRDYIMRSPQPLLVPLLVLTLGGAGLLLLHTAVHGHISSAVANAADEASAAIPALTRRGTLSTSIAPRNGRESSAWPWSQSGSSCSSSTFISPTGRSTHW